jgi:hypothetical protein
MLILVTAWAEDEEDGTAVMEIHRVMLTIASHIRRFLRLMIASRGGVDA